MIDSYGVVARVAAGFGVTPEPPTTRLSGNGTKRVGVLRAEGCPGRGVTSWATVAASFFPSPYRTPDGRPVCVEFVAAVDSRWDRVGDTLAAAAFAVGPGNDVRPGTVYRDAVRGTHPTAATA